MSGATRYLEQFPAPSLHLDDEDPVWIPMVATQDGVVRTGNTPMTRSAAINCARSERKRLESAGQVVRIHGVLMQD